MRGGQGIPNIDNFQRNGPVVASFPATMCDQFMPAPTKLSQSKPSQAKPSQAKPSQAKLSRGPLKSLRVLCRDTVPCGTCNGCS